MAANYTDKDLVDLLKMYDKERKEAKIAFPNRLQDIEVSYHNRAFRLLLKNAKL